MRVSKSCWSDSISFNPLDRGNLNQIMDIKRLIVDGCKWFQSPRSGKFESNIYAETVTKQEVEEVSIP